MALASIHFFGNFLWHLVLSNAASTNQWIVKLFWKMCKLKFWKWIEWLAHTPKDGIAFSFQCSGESKPVSRGPAWQGRGLKTYARLNLLDPEFCRVFPVFMVSTPRPESCKRLQRRCGLSITLAGWKWLCFTHHENQRAILVEFLAVMKAQRSKTSTTVAVHVEYIADVYI